MIAAPEIGLCLGILCPLDVFLRRGLGELVAARKNGRAQSLINRAAASGRSCISFLSRLKRLHQRLGGGFLTEIQAAFHELVQLLAGPRLVAALCQSCGQMIMDIAGIGLFG